MGQFTISTNYTKIILKVIYRGEFNILVNLRYSCMSKLWEEVKEPTENPCRHRKNMENLHRPQTQTSVRDPAMIDLAISLL